jgi:SAM-dependent methyltransferase
MATSHRSESSLAEAARLRRDTVPVCAFCDSRKMHLIMDFGDVALAGGFLKPERFADERFFPLRLFFCEECFAVQVVDKVPAEVLFHDYFYFSSSIGTLRDHFKQYAAEVTARFLDAPNASVLEFGCNDGVLLRPLADQGIRTVIGVDPATNVVSTIDDARVRIVNDFFGEAVAQRIVAEHGKLDMVMANNVYAHIPDIQGITRAISQVLKDDGVFVFEVHYLGKVIDEMQYDMVYHEHLYYYSLLSALAHFDRYDMTVFDVKPVPIHAGSMRFYVCKKGSKHARQESEAVRELKRRELAQGFDRYETFRLFSRSVAAHKDELCALLDRLRSEGHRIAGYGASGRANTMIQYCGINHQQLDYMIDDAPAKTGFYTPGSHFQIHSSKVLEQPDAPDHLLVFAWSFFEEIRRRNADYLNAGGSMILPLPRVSIHSARPA